MNPEAACLCLPHCLACRRMSVLITGFGPFDGGSNASEALVRALAERTAELEAVAGQPVDTLVLPVDTVRAGALLDEAVAAIRPALLLLCGQAAGRDRICLERFATNRRHFGVPDATGAEIRDALVLDTGPDRLIATWPDLDGTVDALNAAGVPAAISEDCGTHLCNQVLYLALHAAAASGQNIAATFLHVPLLPEQVARGEVAAVRHERCPSLPLEILVRGVGILLGRVAALGAAA